MFIVPLNRTKRLPERKGSSTDGTVRMHAPEVALCGVVHDCSRKRCSGCAVVVVNAFCLLVHGQQRAKVPVRLAHRYDRHAVGRSLGARAATVRPVCNPSFSCGDRSPVFASVPFCLFSSPAAGPMMAATDRALGRNGMRHDGTIQSPERGGCSAYSAA